MSTTATRFYVTGGTVPPGTPSYVERQADRELFDALLRGEFCYVLHARQMGKSSLMAHATARLREAGIAVVNLDLTRLGQNLSVEQWYDGLLGHLGRQLNLEDELEDYWLDHERLSPLQRWLGALHDVVLAQVPEPLVIAVDEIDAVRSLPFSTDEFFAAIRDCYNRRSLDPEFGRVTFCLLGVATPSDLIQDTRTTPFNIGRRIELTDFTAAEAAPLAQGLGGDATTNQTLLQRALFWTGGHPYLTQRLCQAVAREAGVRGASDVDRLCGELFLAASVQEKDDNLLFVRERLLKSEAAPAALLDLYGQVRSGKRMAPDDTNQLVSLLRLSGVTRVESGRLQIRNRIYERVFDRDWVIQHMPDAELVRQKAAYRRGLLRATMVAGVIVAVMAGLVLTAVRQTRRADRQARRADRIARQEAQTRQLAEGRLYAADMNVAQQFWDAGNAERAQELLDSHRPRAGEADQRGFEWRYLWRLFHADVPVRTLRGHTSAVNGVSFSPDGRTLASSSGDWTVKLWDVTSGRGLATLKGFKASLGRVAFSPDGKLLATGDGDGSAELWDVASRRQVALFRGHKGVITGVQFSANGKVLATSSTDKTVKLWNVRTGQPLATLRGHAGEIKDLALSPDGRTLATASPDSAQLWDVATGRALAALSHPADVNAVAFSPDGRILATGSSTTVRLWDVATWQETAIVGQHSDAVSSLVFSPDGRTLATGGTDHTVKLWDVATRHELTTLRGHTNSVHGVAFSPDGKTLASAGWDRTIKLWAVGSILGNSPGQREASRVTLTGHKKRVGSVAFSPNGRLVASSSWDQTVRLWDTATGTDVATLRGQNGPIWDVAFSPDGKTLAAASGHLTRPGTPGGVALWDVASRRQTGFLKGHTSAVQSVAFSPDGKLLASGSADATTKLWNVASRRALFTLKGHDGWVSWQHSVAFSPNSKTLAVASSDGTAKLWDVTSGRVLAALQEHKPPVIAVAFSPDGNTLATTDWEGTVRLWDVATRREFITLKGHTGRVFHVAFSPDSDTLATTSSDRTVKLWNLGLKQEVLTLSGHTAPVNAAAFSPDGSTLATGSDDATMRLWRAATFEEANVAPVSAFSGSGSDRSVALQWRPVAQALAYQLYRGPSHASRARLVKLTPRPITDTSFTDHGSALVNGRPQTYGIAPLFKGAGPGQILVGPLETLQASPVTTPPGFLGGSINEGEQFGSARFQPATGEIAVRGSGQDIWGQADGCYFLYQPVTEDFQITARALTRPTESHEWAKAGLTIRESLAAGARNGCLVITPRHGLHWQWRPSGDEATAGANAEVLSHVGVRLPLLLRLARRGNTITAAYSTDNGRSYRPADPPVTFGSPLPATLYAGLAITANDASKVSEAKFRDLQVQPLRR